MFKKSILVKILSIVVGISIIGFTILIYKVISQEEKNLLEERKKTSDLMTQPILHTIYKDMLDERADMVYYLMQNIKDIKGVERIQIIRGNGVEAAFSDDKTLKIVEKEYGELKPEWKTPRIPQPIGGASGTDYQKFKEALSLFNKGSTEGISYTEKSEGKRLLTYLIPIEARQKCHACHISEDTIRGVLMISTTLEDMYASLSASRMLWIMYGFFTVLGASIVLTIFVRTITNPLSKIAKSSKKIANGELDISVDIKSNDEIGILASAFTEMVAYLKGMAGTAEKIANGDLTGNITPRSDRDVLGNSFKKMITGLNDIVGQIRSGSDQMVSASSEIAATAEQTSANTETAATAVEEITSTMHEMSVNTQNVSKNIRSQSAAVTQTSSSIEELLRSIQSVADNATRLADLSRKSSEAVGLGNSAVYKSSGSINNITKVITNSANTVKMLGSKADDIGKIVEVIDDIAEQTNLLSLNAAIEAARAGEHGMGFAVVADEVRKLAERAGKSTKEIAELIYGIQKETQTAVKDVEQSVGVVGEALKLSSEVVESLKKIELAVIEASKYSSEISAATNEQASGCDQISKAIIKLNEITQEVSASADEQASGTQEVVKAVEKLRDMVQQNASGATELASSAEELSRQAESLTAVAGRFVTEEEEAKNKSKRQMSNQIQNPNNKLPVD